MKFSGAETIKDDLNTISFIEIFIYSIGGKLTLPNIIKIIEKIIKPINENLCLLLFCKKADRIAIT